MIAAVYIPIWVIPLVAEVLLVSWIVWDDARQRKRKWRARERIRARRGATSGY